MGVADGAVGFENGGWRAGMGFLSALQRLRELREMLADFAGKWLRCSDFSAFPMSRGC
jgi:hypothetical protein